MFLIQLQKNVERSQGSKYQEVIFLDQGWVWHMPYQDIDGYAQICLQTPFACSILVSHSDLGFFLITFPYLLLQELMWEYQVKHPHQVILYAKSLACISII